jgi:mannose-6-phosphate isomerase-like protein (cupin superfamily)
VNWVAGLEGSPGRSDGGAIRNDKIAIGMTVLEPGHTQPAAKLPVARLYLVASGQAITDIGNGNTVLGKLDGLHLAPGEIAALRNNGPEPLRLFWVDAPGS